MASDHCLRASQLLQLRQDLDHMLNLLQDSTVKIELYRSTGHWGTGMCEDLLAHSRLVTEVIRCLDLFSRACQYMVYQSMNDMISVCGVNALRVVSLQDRAVGPN